MTARRPDGTIDMQDKEEIDMNAPTKAPVSAWRDQRVPASGPVKGSGFKRPSVNITPAERVGRILTGAVAAIAGGVLLTSAGSILSGSLEVLLVLAGLDLVITGALGHCPLYKKLGYVPPSLRGPA